MTDKFPVTERTDVLPSDNSFPKKKIREGWGAETEAANMPNTPSMTQYKRVSSINLYADYCDSEGHQLYDQYQVRKPDDTDNDND
jgi:hypothetical protein